MKRNAPVIRVAIMAFWIVMAGWLIRYEAYPEYFTNSLAGYSGLLTEDVIVRDSWMRILIKGQPIGYTHTSIETDEANPLRYYTVRNRTSVRLNMLGASQGVNVDTTVYVDPTQTLQEFEFSFSAGRNGMSIRGKRKDADNFDVAMKSPAGERRMALAIPRDTVIYSPLTEMAVKKLRPGQSLIVRTLDPASLTAANMTIRALRYETLALSNRQVRVTVMAAEFQGVTANSWIDGDGNVLKQDTPMGWVLEACSQEEAFAAIQQGGREVDVLTEMAVPCEGVIAQPKEARRLRLRLTGVEFPTNALSGPRQRAARTGPAQFELVVKAARMPRPGTAAGALPAAEAAAALAATPYIQTGDPVLVDAVRKILEGETNDVMKAQALYRWVNRNVRKKMTASMPSAVDVLNTLEGDCNEHTYLFTGLARTAGLPAKVMVGIVYQDGAFYYHAWPAVWLGAWVEMDPTWGQETVDATHIRLVEGELASQVELMNIIGRLKIKVLESGTGEGPDD